MYAMNLRYLKKTVFICLLIVPMLGSSSAAQAMSEKAIGEQLIDKTVTFYHNKKDHTVTRYFDPDGTLLQMHENNGFEKGSWQIDGGKLCIALPGRPVKCRNFIKKKGVYGTANKKGKKLVNEIEASVDGNQIKIPTEAVVPKAVTDIREEVVSLNTRKSITQSFLLVEPSSKPKAVVLLIPGHEGVVRFKKIGKSYDVYSEGGGLPAHETARFKLSEAGFAVAVIAPPSDRKHGMGTSFRRSKEHATDVGAVVEFLNNRYNQKVNIWGHCRSTFSPPAILAHNGSKGIAGMILTSTRSTGKQGSVLETEGPRVKVPTLLVHHVDDPCDGTPYSNLGKLESFYGESAPDVKVIAVSGGDGDRGASTYGCSGGYHAFKGKRGPVVKAVARWLQQEPVPTKID